jgi:hypothetical protein
MSVFRSNILLLVDSGVTNHCYRCVQQFAVKHYLSTDLVIPCHMSCYLHVHGCQLFIYCRHIFLVTKIMDKLPPPPCVVKHHNMKTYCGTEVHIRDAHFFQKIMEPPKNSVRRPHEASSILRIQKYEAPAYKI